MHTDKRANMMKETADHLTATKLLYNFFCYQRLLQWSI